ncbi:MAG: iron ABC transporter permease [Pseudomonadota bacterium]
MFNRDRDRRGALTIAGLLVGLALLMLASLHLGLRHYAPWQVFDAVFANGQGTDALIIRTLRLPRTFNALAVGAALAVSGLLMQSTTRNPLAAPGVLGVNAGAALAVVVGLSAFGIASLSALAGLAAFGAMAATALVFGITLSAGASFSPVHVLLAGVTVAALLASFTQILLVTDESTMEALLFWLAGGFADRPLILLAIAAPFMAIAFLAVMPMTRALDALMTDDASAQALGVPVVRIRLTALGLAAILAGLSVSVAGPVAFIGLIAPHIARRLGVRGHAQLVPAAALVGAMLAVAADILARYLVSPGEAPVGAVLALIGVPVLIALLRSRRMGLQRR